MTKEISQLEQVLIDTIQKSTKVGGEVYDGVKSVTTSAIDFAQAQIPEVIQQLLMWKLTESTIYLILCLAALYGCYKVTKLLWKATDGMIAGPFGAIAISIFIFAVNNLLKIVKIIIAPKLFLIEYAASLLK